MSDKPKRRWYQFSLLALILLTTAVSVPLAWLAYERNEVHKAEKVIATIGKLGGSVELGEEKSFPPNWLRPLLGGRTPGEIATADVPGTKVTDADLSQFAWLTKLKAVSLYNCTEVTDDGLAHLAGLKELEKLSLNGTKVTDSGLVHLAGMKRLRYVSIGETQVTDAGLAHLAGLTELERLDLEGGTQLTENGLSELRKKLPGLRILGNAPAAKRAP